MLKLKNMIFENYEHMFYYRKIKPGFIWVEGDNGSVSKDSNTYGEVHISCVEGKVLFNLTSIFSNKHNSTRKKTFVIDEDKYFLKVDWTWWHIIKTGNTYQNIFYEYPVEGE